MPADALSDSQIGGSGPSRSTQRAVNYPSPFFDLAGTYMPDSPKALMRHCRYFYYTVAVIGAAIDVHAGYPVTDIVLDEEDAKLTEKWHEILHNKFHIKSFMVESGKDYHTTGNVFISLYMPFDRHLICLICKVPSPISTVEYTFRNYKFEFTCPKCTNHGRADIKDEPVKDLERVNLVRWSAENMDIDYNPISGERFYKYNVPADVRRMVQAGRRHIVEKLPLVFIEACRDQTPININRENIFHLRRPALAEKNMGWGEPAMIRVLKDTFYLQLLRKAREVIAQQHIVPLWVLFPQPHGELDPYQHLNLAEWRSRVEDEIKKWRQDPNYIPIMPMPVGFQFIGGNFKNLDTTPEIQNLLLNILAGMNMPQEFVYGGLQYSGTSFSIRMLSNLFSSYRSQLLEFLNGFLIKKVAEFFDIPKVKAHFTDLKMADDVQKKTLLVQLNQLNKLSTGTLLSELGFDAEKELKKIKDELKQQGELIGDQMVEQEKAKSRAMIENIKGQIRAQAEQQSIAAEVQLELAQRQIQLEGDQEFKINPDLFSSIFKAAPGDAQHQDASGRDFFTINPVSLPQTVLSMAKALLARNEKQRKDALSEIQTTMPMLHDLVVQQMQTIGAPGNAQPVGLPLPAMDGRPLPAQKPPRRNNGQA